MTADTVQIAASTPEVTQPFAELGLKSEEYEKIREILGRRPTNAELAMYSVMWSEHCSYKSSKVHLRKLGQIASQTKVLAGIGENAGVVDIGDGWAATFKVESHNHPSYIEPYQGAATGVGGIVRDIVAMGARPVAVMDSLRFGSPSSPDVQRVIGGVVAGIAGYGNCLGLPNIGGETKVHSSYAQNPLVNALCVGVMRHEDVHFARASGAGNLVVLYGARTGGDGIGGVSILASETFDDSKTTKRPSVQVGDPFTEKLLIEATMEMFAEDLVLGIQDLGGAGLSCATSELASNGNCGMRVELEKVSLRDSELTPEEILMSESQERMCAIVTPKNLPSILSICTKWGLNAEVIGQIIDEPKLVITWHGQEIVNVPPRSVAHDGPVYERPFERSLSRTVSKTNDFNLSKRDLKADYLDLLKQADVADVTAVTDQYDRYVRGQTIMFSPSDAGVIRVADDTNRGIAVSLDGNGRLCDVDTNLGTQWLVAEAYRNVAMTGARPIALTNCLNFGSPEDSKVMGQFVSSVEGLAEAASAFEIPVTGGNVSFYNQTGDLSILPTPIIGVLGVIEDVRKVIPSFGGRVGDHIWLLGTTIENLYGSLWSDLLAQTSKSGDNSANSWLPEIDVIAEKNLAALLESCAQEGLVECAHDVSEGGLSVAIAELADYTNRQYGHEQVSFSIKLPNEINPFFTMFSEFGGRAIVLTTPENSAELQHQAKRRDVPFVHLGEVVNPNNAPSQICFEGLFSVTIEQIRRSRKLSAVLSD